MSETNKSTEQYKKAIESGMKMPYAQFLVEVDVIKKAAIDSYRTALKKKIDDERKINRDSWTQGYNDAIGDILTIIDQTTIEK